MKHLTIMLKPASSLCNLRCKYCFYADITSLREVSSFGVMKESAMTAVMDHIFIDLDDGDYLTLSFQGGEPMLAGLPFYRNLVQYIAGKKRNIHINYTLQTWMMTGASFLPNTGFSSESPWIFSRKATTRSGSTQPDREHTNRFFVPSPC